MRVQPFTYTSNLIHRVTLTLDATTAAGARIFYSIGSNASGWTPEVSFLSHPGVGPNVPVNVMVLADMDVQCFDGKVCNPQAVVRALTTTDLIATATGGALFCGDLSYASGNNTHWDAWQDFFGARVMSWRGWPCRLEAPQTGIARARRAARRYYTSSSLCVRTSLPPSPPALQTRCHPKW